MANQTEAKVAEELKEVAVEEKRKVFTFEGNFSVEKLFDTQKLEKIKKSMDIAIPLFAVSSDEKNIVVFTYESRKAYDEGKCMIAGQDKELVKKIYDILKSAVE